MKKLTVFTTAFVTAAGLAGAAQAQDFIMPPASMPSSACNAFVTEGTDQGVCLESLREWTEYLQNSTVSQLESGKAVIQAGNADAPATMRPPEGLPNGQGKLYAAHVKAACEPFNALAADAGAVETVVAADECLRRAHMFASQELGGTTIAADIEYVGGTMVAVAGKLQSLAAPTR